MHVSGRVAADAPDPSDAVRARVAALGVRVAGLVPQRHLEDQGVVGLQTTEHGSGANAVTVDAAVTRSYVVWRNPDDRDDPVNLAELSAAERTALDQPVPDDLPAWLLAARDRMRLPMLWDAVTTHWSADGDQDARELLRAHVDHVLHNRYRAEHALGDPTDGRRWRELVTVGAVRPHPVVVDGEARDGLLLDTDPFVVGTACTLDDGRVVTAVVDRDLARWVEVAFVSDAG